MNPASRTGSRVRAWVVRAGDKGQHVKHNLQHDVVTIEWDFVGDLRNYPTKEALKQRFSRGDPKRISEHSHNKSVGGQVAKLLAFRDEIERGDVIVMPLKDRDRNQYVAIGRVTGAYEHDAAHGPGVHHRIPVEWLADRVYKHDLGNDILISIGAGGTVFEIGADNAAELLFRVANADADTGEPMASELMTPMYVLTWNPRPQTMNPADQKEHRDYWLEKLRSTEGDATSDGSWSTGSRKGGINKGDDLVLFLHGAGGGIIASGTAASEVYGNPADGTNWVDVEWEHWVAAEDCLPVAQLRNSIAPTFFEYAPRGSGRRLSDEEATSLKQAWQELLEQPPSLSGDEVGVRATTGQTVPEGAVSRAEVNRYERSRWARAECLRHYGHECQVCGLDFEERYGELGEGFMHVHHVTPMHEIAGNPDYRLDHIKDRRPVCPNCHAMLHRPNDRTLTVEELRELLSPEDSDRG